MATNEKKKSPVGSESLVKKVGMFVKETSVRVRKEVGGGRRKREWERERERGGIRRGRDGENEKEREKKLISAFNW